MLKLKAEKREIFGKKLKVARQEDKLPAVIYGPKRTSESIFVPLTEFQVMWKKAGESSIVNIELPDGKKEEVLIHEVDQNPVTDELIHADFYAAEMDKLIQTNIPLVFTGISSAVKEQGGVLLKVMHEVTVEALPKDLPHEIEIDISLIKNIGESIAISSLKLPKDVSAVNKADEVIVIVESQKEEVVEEVPVSVEDIKVEEKGKKEEDKKEETK